MPVAQPVIVGAFEIEDKGPDVAIDFEGVHYSKYLIRCAFFFYVRFAVSYCDLEEIMAESGVNVDLATLNRRGMKFAPTAAAEAQQRKSSTCGSWRVDETSTKPKGEWMICTAQRINKGNP